MHVWCVLGQTHHLLELVVVFMQLSGRPILVNLTLGSSLDFSKNGDGLI